MTARHRVAVLVLPGVLPLEFGIAAQVFGTDPHYALTVLAADRSRPVPGAGFAITATAGLGGLRRADTVIVPGYEDVDAPLEPAVLGALRRAHRAGCRIVAICSAAFALAEASLLDGRPATTHWRRADELQRRYPRVHVVADRLFVDDDDVLTSAGVTAGVDLCLHLVRRDFGAAAANIRARALVAPPYRSGGQAQYVERLVPDARGRQLAPLREWLLEHLDHRIDIDTLAARSAMSRRTFLRRFREETGTSPLAWLTSARLDRARELLESTDTPVERLGELTGLGSPESVRAAFHRSLGTSPQAYRTLFRQRLELDDDAATRS